MSIRNYKTLVDITIDCVIAPDIVISPTVYVTEKEIAFNGLVWDRKCAGGNKLTFGDIIASQLDLTLINRPLTPEEQTEQGRTGRYFDVYHFEGAKVTPRLSFMWEELVEGTWVSRRLDKYLGIFWVDNMPVMGNTFRLVCYDTAVKLDAVLTPEQLALLVPENGRSVLGILSTLNSQILNAYDCIFGYPQDFIDHPPGNRDALIRSIDPSQTECTVRDVIRWVLELWGCVAYIGRSNNSSMIIPVRYNTLTQNFKAIGASEIISITVQAANVNVNSVRMTAGDYTVQTGKTVSDTDGDPYPVEITDNGLWTWTEDTEPADIQTAITALSRGVSDYFFPSSGTAVGQMTYRPMTIDLFNYSDINLGETVWVSTKDHSPYCTLITGSTYTLNGGTRLTSIGQSNVAEGWAAKPLLTASQKAVISRVFDYWKKFWNLPTGDDLDAVETKANDAKATATTAQGTATEAKTKVTTTDNYLKKLIEMNVGQSHVYGMYETYVGDGTTEPAIRYWHDNSTLATSSTVFRFSSSGMAWTTQYDGDDTVWKNAIDAQGNALLRNITAWDVTANDITAGKLQSADGLTYFDLTNNQLVINNANSSITLGSGALQTKITPSEAQIGNPLTMRTVDSYGGTVASCEALKIDAWDTNYIAEYLGYDSTVKRICIGKRYGLDQPVINYQYDALSGEAVSINIPTYIANVTSRDSVNILDNSAVVSSLQSDRLIINQTDVVRHASGGAIIIGSATSPLQLRSSADVQIAGKTLSDFVILSGTVAKTATQDSQTINITWHYKQYKSGEKEAWCSVQVPSWAVTSQSGGIYYSPNNLSIHCPTLADCGGTGTNPFIGTVTGLACNFVSEGVSSAGGLRSLHNGMNAARSNCWVQLRNSTSATVTNAVIGLHLWGST